MSTVLVLAIAVFVVLVLDFFWRSLRRDIRTSAKTLPNPADTEGKVYQFGISSLTVDIPLLSFAMMMIASCALSAAFFFFLDLPVSEADLLFFSDPEAFWVRTSVLSVVFMSVLMIWYRMKMSAYRKAFGKEIVTSSTGVQFTLFMDRRWLRSFLRILRGEAYLGFRWDEVSEWRVVRTWYPSSSGGGYWMQEYRIRVEGDDYILYRDPLLGLEDLFLEDVRGRIGEKLKMEDLLVVES